MLLEMSLDQPEFLKQLVVLKDFQIFDMVVGFVVSFKLLSWFSWVDAFKNTKLSEVLER